MGAEDRPSDHEKWMAEQQFRKDELAAKNRELDIQATTASREAALKKAELKVKIREVRRGRWTNPLVIAVLTAAFAGFGNVFATLYSARQQRALDTQRSHDSRALEREKSEANLILEVVKTPTPERAADNLEFLVATKLISDQTRRNDITNYINSGRRINIPPPALGLEPAGYELSITCAVRGGQIEPVVAAVDNFLDDRLKIAKDAGSRVFPGGLDRTLFFGAPGISGIGQLATRIRLVGSDVYVSLSVKRSELFAGSGAADPDRTWLSKVVRSDFPEALASAGIKADCKQPSTTK